MKRLSVAIVFAWFVTGCGDNAAPAPDAALPSCADVGCPNAALCRLDNLCVCIHPDGSSTTCHQEPAP